MRHQSANFTLIYISFGLFCFNYSFTLFGTMCPISPFPTELSAFYEHFCGFLSVKSPKKEIVM